MFYLIIFAVLFIAELLYFRIADKFNIIDKPNERSSHNYITIRGGEIIWWVAALLFLLFHFSSQGLWFFAGFTFANSFFTFAVRVLDLYSGKSLVIKFLSRGFRLSK